MEINDGNIQTMVTYLEQTLSNDVNVRRQAEQFLKSVELNENYSVLLLKLTGLQNIPLHIRVSSAVTFKNFIKCYWGLDEDGNDRISLSNRTTIKTMIVEFMLSSPEGIQRQLSEAISIIGKHDFPDKWSELLPLMIAKFSSGDLHAINGILRTARSLFQRYCFESKCQELWTEIKYVLDNFARPLQELFIATHGLLNQYASNLDALKVIFSSLTVVAELFYSLNFQDLPEFFEDNMEVWMSHFLQLLSVENNKLDTSADDEAGVIVNLKSQICDNIELYAQKYDEEFQPYLPKFVTVVWNLLVSTGNQIKYDLLVSNAIQFLATVADRAAYKSLFEVEDVLQNVCEKIVIPNMEFRECDEELFEDNPEEYIRRDLEGSDAGTRRRAACELVKSLSKYFEVRITEIFGGYVQTMLSQYASDRNKNWKSKDAALYLVTSLATKAQTARHGTTQTNQLVNLNEFFTQHVVPELQDPNPDNLSVLKADSLKYLITFRSQLKPELLIQSVPFMVSLLKSKSVVVHSYASIILEKIQILKNDQGSPLVPGQTFLSLSESLLNNLFNVFLMPGSEENEYTMKAIMRIFNVLQEAILPYLSNLLPVLTNKLALVAKNPSKPHFNHYLFETLCLSIRIVCVPMPSAVLSFEEALFPVFQQILQQDVQEFIPYVFQVLSILMEFNRDSVGGPYVALFPCLLVPSLWERSANIHPLTTLLQVYIRKSSQTIVTGDKLPALLGVFQKLIASKTHDHEGFYLIGSLVQYSDYGSLSPYMKQVMILLFQRLTSSKTSKFVRCFQVFLCLFCVKAGPVVVSKLVDDIQPQMFGMVLEKILIPEIRKVDGETERKICAGGMTKLLCELPDLISGTYQQFWVPLLEALIGLFELPLDESVPKDEHFIEIEDTPGYQPSYSQLAFASVKSDNSLPVEINNPKAYLAQCISKLSMELPQQISPKIASGLSPAAQAYLQQYLTVARVQLF